MKKSVCIITVLLLCVCSTACSGRKAQNVNSNKASSQITISESETYQSSVISKTESKTENISSVQTSSAFLHQSSQTAPLVQTQKPVASKPTVSLPPPKPVDVMAENKKKAQQILSEITTPNMTDVEKIKASYKWLYPNFRYRTDKIDLSQGFTESLETQLVSYYFKRRKGSCEHYAAVQKAFINELGYECMYVSGERFSSNTYKWGEHVWLLVNINGNWYHVDGLYGGLFYDVTETTFMVPDSAVEKTHRWDRTKYPACTNAQLLK